MSIFVGVGSQDLLDILVFRINLLLLLREEVVLCQLVVI